MRHKIYGVAIVVIALLATTSLWAHHSPSAIFDMSKRFALTGTLTKIDWINPHIVVAIDVKSEEGKMQSWVFESNPPSWFKRVGVSRSDFAKTIGQNVKVEDVRTKDGSSYGYLQKITFAGGNSLELVSPSEANTR